MYVCVSQGVWMGVLTGAGCLSRVLGPLFVSVVYARRGPAFTFGSTALTTLVAMLVLRLLYPRLRPPPAAATATATTITAPLADHEIELEEGAGDKLCPSS